MVTYEFVCEKCRGHFELEQSITLPLPTACCDCGATEPAFHQNYAETQPFLTVQQDPTTFGQQAERNAKRVGKEVVDMMAEEYDVSNRRAKQKLGLPVPNGAEPTRQRYKPKRPWWRDSDKPLDVSKVKDVKKFVLESKT